MSCKRAEDPKASGAGLDCSSAGSQSFGTEAKMRGFCNMMPAFESVPVPVSRSSCGSCKDPLRSSLRESLSKRMSGRTWQTGYALSGFPPASSGEPACGSGCIAMTGRMSRPMSADISGSCQCAGLCGRISALPFSSNLSAQASSGAVSLSSCVFQELSKAALSTIKDDTASFFSCRPGIQSGMPSVAEAKALMLFCMSVSVPASAALAPGSSLPSVSGMRYRCPDCAVRDTPSAVPMFPRSRSREQLPSSSHIPPLSCILRDTLAEKGREPASPVMTMPEGSRSALSLFLRYPWPDCVCKNARHAPMTSRMQSTVQRTKTRHLRRTVRYLRDGPAFFRPASFFVPPSMVGQSLFSFACSIRMPALC